MRHRQPTDKHSRFVLPVLLFLLGLGLIIAWRAAPVLRQADAPPPDPALLATGLDVSNLAAPTPLLPYITYLRDPSGQLTWADVASSQQAGQLAAAGGSAPNLGITHDAIWVHVPLSNPSAEAVEVILRVDAPTTGEIDLYSGVPNADRPPDFATGATRPYSARPLPGRSFAFPLTVPPGATTDFFLRYKSDLAIRLNSDVWPPEAFAANYLEDEIWWGIVLGMLLLMSGYNFLLYIALRDKMYLVLTVFGVLVAISSAASGGYAARWLPERLSSWSPLLVMASIVGAIGALILLTLTFLELRKHLRPAYWVLVAAAATVGATLMIAAFASFAFAYTLLFVTLLLILATLFVATIVRVRQGSRLALFFLIGQIVPIAFGVLQSISILGIGPRLPILPFIVPINSLFLLVIMSLALADRVNLLGRAADAANAALLDSERRLHSYLDALPFSIQVHDANLKPLFVNSAIRQLRSDRPEDYYDEQYEVWVRDFPPLISGTDHPYPSEQLPLLRAARGEKVHADDVAIQGRNGHTTLEVWAVPLFDDGGKVTAIVTAFQDITARRAVENELVGYRETLEQRVAQRTSELAALNASLAARVAELTAVNEVGRRMARIADLESTLGEIVQLLAQVFRATLANISLFDNVRHSVHIAAMADDKYGSQSSLAGRLFFYDSAYGLPLHQPTPVVLRDPAQLPGIPADVANELVERGITQVLTVPLVAREQIIGAFALLVDDAERIFTADETRVAQTIAGQVAAAIDTLQLIDEVRQQRDAAEALRRTATALSRNLDQQNVLGTILEQLDQVFACEGAAVSLVEGQELVTVAAKGLSAVCLGRRISVNGSGDGSAASLIVLHSRQPTIVDDTQNAAEQVCCADTQPIRSWLGVPLVSGNTAIGVLNLDSVQPGSFTQAQADLLAIFANQAAIAVANARLYDQAQVSAVAGERSRLARDLHDAVTQTIFSASLIASTLPARLPELPPAAQADVDMLQMLTRGALAEMRTLLLELRPERLAEVPVETLLAQLAQAFSGRTGVPATVNANCDPGFAPPYAVKIAFYRVAQEALNNAAKHARAGCVTIRFSTRGAYQDKSMDSSVGGSVRLVVIDDGRGFAAGSVGPERLGLAIMHERAAAIGAQLTVDSEPGLGTHVFMVWNDENYTQTA